MLLILHGWYDLNNVTVLKNKKMMNKTKKFISVKVTIQNTEEYEVDSCWSQETQLFCEEIAKKVKDFIEEMTTKPNALVRY